jgi:hypothetical protein
MATKTARAETQPLRVPAADRAPARALTSLRQDLARVREKIREDLFRFRTCCADPRASK